MNKIHIMNTLNDRESSILEYIVRDYILTAEPVSSASVSKKTRIGVSPATARNIMADLGDIGYLEQPHTSSGRIPTDKAYRYFVDNLMNDANLLNTYSGRTRKERHNFDEEIRNFARKTAEAFGIFTVIAVPGHEVFLSGIDEIFKEPEFKELEVSRAFAKLLDNIPEIAEKYHETRKTSFSIYIGNENIFSEGEYFSSIFGSTAYDEPSFVAFSIGPKRMDYERCSTAVRKLIEGLECF